VTARRRWYFRATQRLRSAWAGRSRSSTASSTMCARS
jgi:hypothetical protein